METSQQFANETADGLRCQAMLSELTGSMEKRLEEQTRFESFMADLSLHFVNLAASEVDGVIENSLRVFCDALALDRSCLFQQFSSEPGKLLLTHLYESKANPVLAGIVEKRIDPKLRSDIYWLQTDAEKPDACIRFDLQKLWPWTFERIQRCESVIIRNPDKLPAEAARDREMFNRYEARSTVLIPLVSAGECLGCITFVTTRAPRNWTELEVGRFRFIADLFTNALLRKRVDEERKFAEEALLKSYAEIKQLKDRLQAESDFLRAEIKVTHAHSQILGRSQALKRVLHQIEQVAPAECPVLISGETGTGKELVAQEIHRLSARKDHVMVLVNCAALPSALVESELFGRERGAYTGALTSQVGRFEVADGSTIFLDEIGELSLEVQAKLLRVLQQGEFQRLGSPKTYKVDVRIIAATNHDLAEDVRRGRFREDLYYRLKVFPIDIPPLRQRVDDIPTLVFAFMEEFSTRMGKKITKIPRKAMEVLQGHGWPGNIRELRNVIEHSIILSAGDTLKLTLMGEAPTRETPITLAQAERDHILKTLESTGWRIKGPHGAAVRLDMQPSTLYSRMQKLGIPHRRQKDEMATNR